MWRYTFINPSAVWAKINATVASAEKAAPKQEPVPAPIIAPMVASPEAEPAVAQPAPAPKLKIKLGSSQAAGEPATNAEKAPVKPSKPKASKPRATNKARATDMPPPPYIDDGSHDLLQEVIAMEELNSHTPRKESKQRRTIELDPEDELLILASPSRDENSAVDTIPQELPPVAPPVSVPVAPPKPTPTPTSLKISRPTERVKPIVEKGKEKGKEKEKTAAPVPAPTVASAHVPLPVAPLPKRKTPPTAPAPVPGQSSTPVNESRVRDALKVIMNMPQSIIFNQPVDPIRDGCPTYGLSEYFITF